jgi:hypothetical protein
LGELPEYRHPAVAVELSAEGAPSSIAAGTYVFSVQRWQVRGLQDLEKLHFAAVQMGAAGSLLDPDRAEELVLAAASRGTEWPGAHDLDLTLVVRAVNEACLGRSDDAYDLWIAEITDQNEDRADIQERTLESHLRNQLAKLETVRDRHRRHSRSSLVSATEGRMGALRNRVEQRKLEIGARRQLQHRKDEIAVGLIRVAGE